MIGIFRMTSSQIVSQTTNAVYAMTAAARKPLLIASKSRAGTPRQTRHPPSPARRRGLDRADAVRRVRRQTGVHPLAGAVLDPRLLGLRGEPAGAARLRHGRGPA